MNDRDAATDMVDEAGNPSGVSRRTVLGSALALGGAASLGAGGVLGAGAAGAAPVTAGLPDGGLSKGAPAIPGAALSASAEKRVRNLLARMTLEEKLGQLQLINTPEAAATALAGPAGLGGVFSVVGTAKINAVQKIAIEQTRLRIPLIFGLDVIHGYTTNFPIPLGQASSFDPEVARTDARVSAAEARRSGIHWTYAPMMDVTHEPRWGRISEGNGEDPYLTSQFAVAKTQGYQGSDISGHDQLAACAKHYVAYGGTEGGRDYNTVDVSVQRLHNQYLPPFKASVQAGVATVMTSFNTISGIPAHGNSSVVRGVLKNLYGFAGFVVSDYTGIQELIVHGLVADGAGAAAAGIRAGVDMEMVSTNYLQYGRKLLRQGRITQAEIDDAVLRILRVKSRLGLFERPYTPEAGEVTAPTRQSLLAARHAASRSMVLLKNDGYLPLKNSVTSIAVIGPLGNATYDLNGSWTGLGTGSATTPPVTVVDGLQAALPKAGVTFTPGCGIEDPDTSGFAAAIGAAKAADAVILALGESSAMSGEAAARSDIGLPGVQDALVAAIAGAGVTFAAVLFNGRPLTIPDLTGSAAAILEAWAPGVQGGSAVADILVGAVNPGGKLPVTFPRSVGQLPIYYNHENTGRPADPANKYTSKYLDLPSSPLFEFGFGLSYTEFTVSGVSLSATTMRSRGGRITVRARVANTGGSAGDEVVQLYIHDPVASIVQPVRRLRGFHRVTLPPGGSQTVTFVLTPADVGFYDNAAAFRVEKGAIEVYVGTSSVQATLAGTFTIV